MQEANFEEAFELIRARDARYHREAYLFVREALDHTQKNTERSGRVRVRHVTGQELLQGIREYALAQFGPMTVSVFEEWGIRSCRDFGEIVFNMVEVPTTTSFAEADIKEARAFVARLENESDPLSRFLRGEFLKAGVLRASREEVALQSTGAIANALNRIISTGDLYEAERFSAMNLSEQARALLKHRFAGVQLARRNRLLLEEAYPHEIAKGPGLLAKTEKDTRADFEGGYDFWEAFRKPFLPEKGQGAQRLEADAARA